ncbi:Pyridine nucleotide-disulphide oxidoreductase [Halopelagius inordinatus]|uniref:Pyridine nucleotide-disulphide oxidoreductase n=1 Tax=Halopelagius inordinatus TaxID=553467 RepID=A0A1I2NYJ4_9EURY|nr:NAD(P)/FAD-dependent oxidoreductase [Halopelagius inordinatus]SFG08972.1 Pyridine nucleotide-disulphide oxidoreductase [Halopelagius inordinatus]
MSSEPTSRGEGAFDYDVAVVGGGPAGCSAAVFTARYGLETAVFDRGRSSLRRCAYLENYLGFPAGIDVETLYGLLHDHAEEAGCEVVSDLVESVEVTDDPEGFAVETQESGRVTARRVVAATRYDGEYMRGLDDDAEMFVTHDHGGEEHEHFDREYSERDGTTPVDGLYVASPAEEADHQAILAAGRGARVGLTVVADARRGDGYPDAVARHYDWVRREAELDDEWRSRDRWREWFDDRLPDEIDRGAERLDELREREIDRRLDAYLSEEERNRRTERGQRRLLEHLDDELVLEAAREIESERGSTD